MAGYDLAVTPYPGLAVPALQLTGLVFWVRNVSDIHVISSRVGPFGVLNVGLAADHHEVVTRL
jgi:hypothetical protein